MSAAVVDLFAGPGGWDEGARMLGLDDVLGVENEPNACATAEAAGHARLNADIAAVDPRDVAPGIVGLIASPPCPGFSSAGKGLGRKDLEMLTQAIKRLAYGDDPATVLDDVRAAQHDERSALTLEPLRWIIALRPEWIALEQVPQVLPLWQVYADALRPMGYNVHAAYVHAEQYGVPQTRKRAVLAASLAHEVGQPTPTHSRYYPHKPSKLDEGVPRWVSMAEALGMPPEVDGYLRSNYGTGGDPSKRGERDLDQPAPTVTSKIDRNRWVVQTGQNSAQAGGTTKRYERDVDLPAPTVTGQTRSWRVQYVNGNQAKSCRRDVDQPAPTIHFGARSNEVTCQPTPAIEGETAESITWPYDRPSPTIVGSFAPDVVAALGYRRAGDPPRQKTPGSVRVTVEEAATLQSFRPGYPWQGNSGKRYQQVGNAVPPLMAAHILAGLIA